MARQWLKESRYIHSLEDLTPTKRAHIDRTLSPASKAKVNALFESLSLQIPRR